MVFCNIRALLNCMEVEIVTILILIDGFLQSLFVCITEKAVYCHNPYFNRWFSAIRLIKFLIVEALSHNPYFNRWFSAIAAKISQNFTFLCKKLVFSDSFCELYFTQPLYINYCTNYLNNFLLKLAKIKAIINII